MLLGRRRSDRHARPGKAASSQRTRRKSRFGSWLLGCGQGSGVFPTRGLGAVTLATHCTSLSKNSFAN